jgi:predicted nuclease with RNAse H fold
MTARCSPPIVAGIDVGSPRKGFHVVGLNGPTVSKFSSADPIAAVAWCVEFGATVVAVDSPIAWSATGRARPAERALMKSGIWCFSTPTQQIAHTHSKNYFGWMLHGAALYKALREHFEIYSGTNGRQRPICFETFPHAATCALAGRVVRARDKSTLRRQLLEDADVCCDSLTNIDYVDAALCALTARRFAQGIFAEHGDPIEGFIVLPAGRGAGKRPAI